MMRDLTPLLEEFITYEGKCALCKNRSRYSSWCFIRSMVVNEGDSCKDFKERMNQ